jgi:predicted dehydrogenase
MKIRVAIVGFGFMGRMHARVYQALPGVEIAGIIDTSPVARTQASELGIRVPFASSLDILLKSSDFNVVDICLPTDLHCEAIIAAARAGKHIFCEKPLALEIAEAERALEEVEKSGVVLQVGQCIRFWPEYQALERFMKSGKGGKLYSLSLQRRAGRPVYSRDNWLLDRKRSKGAALDLHPRHRLRAPSSGQTNRCPFYWTHGERSVLSHLYSISFR